MNTNVLQQCIWIPAPVLTETTLPDQRNKVFIVTGGYSGVGYELVKILYSKNGIVYLAGRDQKKGLNAIERIHDEHPNSLGRLEFLMLDLSDLSTIKSAADDFKSREQRLDVLTNNAGIGTPPAGSMDAQGHELQMGTNCLGPFLFTQLLLPLLRKTASISPPGSVRVTWAGSLTSEVYAPVGGVVMGEDGKPVVSISQKTNYGQSKVGNIIIASQMALRNRDDGIIHVAFNPGNLRTNLSRHLSWPERVYVSCLSYPAIKGAYTELYAGWSSDITFEHNGQYVWPWGRLGGLRHDVELSIKSEGNGGNGVAKRFWDWCMMETKAFM